MSGVEVHRLSVCYGQHVALRDVTFTAPSGQLTGLVGPNGAGKSTLVKVLVGALRPDEGLALVAGHTPRARPRRHLAYLAQSAATDLNYPIQVEEVVRLGRLPHQGLWRRNTREDRQAVARAIARVGLTGLERRPISTLSGGQRQRTHVARALAQEAQVFVLDEPFTGIDAPTRSALLNLLRELADEGATVLLIDHDVDGLVPRCDQLVLLDTDLVSVGPAPTVAARMRVHLRSAATSPLMRQVP